jgi:hypothetical protein
MFPSLCFFQIGSGGKLLFVKISIAIATHMISLGLCSRLFFVFNAQMIRIGECLVNISKHMEFEIIRCWIHMGVIPLRQSIAITFVELPAKFVSLDAVCFLGWNIRNYTVGFHILQGYIFRMEACVRGSWCLRREPRHSGSQTR